MKRHVGKKTSRKKNKARSKGYALSWKLFSIISFVILLGIGFFVWKNTRNTTFCANSISCIKNLSGRADKAEKGTFDGKTVFVPGNVMGKNKDYPQVLGASAPTGPKHIYVDLTNQTLTAYQGNTLVLKTFISSGKWGPTPTGNFTIWVKLRSTRMTGGQGADYYNLPNVPYVMYFYNSNVPKSEGYGLHGAYWHDNFGHPMSHGCINMRPVDAEALYNWVDPVTTGDVSYPAPGTTGTPLTITGSPPN